MKQVMAFQDSYGKIHDNPEDCFKQDFYYEVQKEWGDEKISLNSWDTLNFIIANQSTFRRLFNDLVSAQTNGNNTHLVPSASRSGDESSTE